MGKKQITINDRTVASLKAYLADFDDDAELVFVEYDQKEGGTIEHGVQIACNFEYQKEKNVAMLMRGLKINREG